MRLSDLQSRKANLWRSLNFGRNISWSSMSEDSKSDRLEALGSLAAGLAHDLNNILCGIQGHLSYLRRLAIEDESMQSSLAAVEEGIRRGGLMSQKILDFARGVERPHALVNLSSLLSSTLELLSTSFPKGTDYSLSGAEEEFFVIGDESQLAQLVLNLLVNASDALEGSAGEIELRLSKVVLDEQLAKKFQTSESETPYVSLSVRDNGVGIPEEIREEVFRAFFSTKKNGGTGLGLSAAKSVLSSHGGLIRLESEEGVGTLVEMLLPFVEAQKTGKREEIASDSQKRRLLVVDDEDVVREVLQKSLTLLGYCAEVASGGAEAIQKFSEAPAPYELVILDMMMPEMSGDQVFAALKEIDPQVRVLISSGYASDERSKRVIDGGAKGFIRKPYSVEELAVEVKRCLESEEGVE